MILAGTKFLSILLITFFVVLENSTMSAQNVIINLEEGTINGKVICNCPLDSITDELGRPSSLSNNPLLGPILKYHDLGLEIWLRPKSNEKSLSLKTFAKPDPNQGIYIIHVHLSKTWDKEASAFYIPNNVSIIPEIDANLKVKDIEDQFSDYITKISTPEEAEKKRIELLGNLYTPPENGYRYTVAAKINDYGLFFSHENVTKFLEMVSINCDY